MNAITAPHTDVAIEPNTVAGPQPSEEHDRAWQEIMAWEDGRRIEAARLMHTYLVARAGAAGSQFDLEAIKANVAPTTIWPEPKSNQTVRWVSSVGPHFWPKQAALPSPELDHVVAKVLELADNDFYSLFGVTVEIGPFWVDITDDCPPSRGFLRRWLRKHQHD